MKTIVKYLEEYGDELYSCEAYIAPNGLIEYAKRGHVNELILYTKENPDDIWNKMPEYASPNSWMVDYTGFVLIWPQFAYLPKNYTKKQLLTISALMKAKQIYKKYQLIINYEMENAKLRNQIHKTGDNSLYNMIKKPKVMTLKEALR